jgi:hypothetical protein
MKLGAEDKQKVAVAGGMGVLAIGAAIYLYTQLFGGPSAAPPAPVAPVVTTRPGVGAPVNEAAKVGTASTQLDPTLHMAAMAATEELVYSGTGRNIFEAGPSPEELQAKVIRPIFPPRPPPVPILPASVQQGPPPKNLKFFGIATQDGKRKALLLAGDDVFLASAGDIVERRYRIVSIAANSVTVEDIPNTNKQNLPLVAN